jgi:hypothetical protein
MLRAVVLASLLFAGTLHSAVAAPSRIVILRGGETAADGALCEIGKQRAQALKLNYLGEKAVRSLFTEEEPPAFFFAITPATAALATPATESWGKPVIFYSVLPHDSEKKTVDALNTRTREAAGNVLNNPTLKGKTVIMVWERTHIADLELDAKFEREASVTLRQLFHLDIVPGVPREWPKDNHNYFWILDFPENSNVPSKFKMVKQEFGKSFPNVPANDWGESSGLADDDGCVQ